MGIITAPYFWQTIGIYIKPNTVNSVLMWIPFKNDFNTGRRKNQLVQCVRVIVVSLPFLSFHSLPFIYTVFSLSFIHFQSFLLLSFSWKIPPNPKQQNISYQLKLQVRKEKHSNQTSTQLGKENPKSWFIKGVVGKVQVASKCFETDWN